MQPSRIAELLAPFLESTAAARPSTQDLISSISTYIDILLRWNARINLTAIRDPEDIVTRHFGESLFAARHLFPFETDIGSASEPVTGQTRASEITGGRPGGIAGERAGGRAALQGRVNSREMSGASAPASANDQPPATNDHPTVADIGCGAGFPGLPIKLWAPHISLTLIESNHKKAAFLKEVTRALTLTDVNIQNARAETINRQLRPCNPACRRTFRSHPPHRRRSSEPIRPPGPPDQLRPGTPGPCRLIRSPVVAPNPNPQISFQSPGPRTPPVNFSLLRTKNTSKSGPNEHNFT